MSNILQWCVALILLGFGLLGQANGQKYRVVGNKKLAYFIVTVDQSGHGDFTSIQSAIDAVPSNNTHWVSIKIKGGTYREKVAIPEDKPYIILKGESKRKTLIVWDDHGSVTESYTFASYANNTIVKSISVLGCSISVLGVGGYITAQKRDSSDETTGFVFKNCKVIGAGSTFLGRPWGAYSRVIFYNSNLTDVVVPEGWSSWDKQAYVKQITYAEYGCYGKGANTSKRVSWEKKLSPYAVRQLVSLNFIDSDGWLGKQPF